MSVCGSGCCSGSRQTHQLLGSEASRFFVKHAALDPLELRAVQGGRVATRSGRVWALGYGLARELLLFDRPTFIANGMGKIVMAGEGTTPARGRLATVSRCGHEWAR
jgi:hypothetical protein